MTLSLKHLAIALISALIIYQIFIIARDFSSTRDIPVRRTIFNNQEKEYLTNYKDYSIQGYPYEEYMIRVQPKSIGDYLCLTNYEGNLLSLLLKIIAELLFILYTLKIDFDSFFRGKHINWLWIIGGVFVFSIQEQASGYWYTETFWEKLFAVKSGGDQQYFFELIHGDTAYYYLMAMILALGVYREIVKKYGQLQSAQIED